MKRPPFTKLGWWQAPLSALAFACSSTGVGNPGAASLSLAIVSDDSEPSVTGEPAALEPLPERALETAFIVLGSLRWLPCADAGDEALQEGPFIVDLLTGEIEPPLPLIPVPSGGFCGFDAPLQPARYSAELAGRSLFFSGTRADDVPFVLFADVRATLRVRAGTGQAWGLEDGEALLWAMRPRRWAAPTELADAEPQAWTGARRTLVIDLNRHPILFAAIRARLATQSGIFRDQDADGTLDESERSEGELGQGIADTDD
jgi:hypothetical protein